MAQLLEHRLKDDTLVREGDGIVAHCICGWSSRPHFTSMSASVAFAEHKERGDAYNADMMRQAADSIRPRCRLRYDDTGWSCTACGGSWITDERPRCLKGL